MSKLYIVLLGVAALSLTVTGAFFSIFGLAQLFAGAAQYVIVMAGVLEFSKIVSAGFLYRYWGHVSRPLRVYLVGAVTTLVCITSVGIFGFLSNAYQKSSFALRTQNIKLAAMQAEDARVNKQIDEIRAFIESIPRNRISRKLEFQQYYQPKIEALKQKSEEIQTRMSTARMEILNTQTKVGPIVYTAEALGVDVDTVVKYLIFVFVTVFDPLAVCLVFCWNLTIRLQEK